MQLYQASRQDYTESSGSARRPPRAGPSAPSASSSRHPIPAHSAPAPTASSTPVPSAPARSAPRPVSANSAPSTRAFTAPRPVSATTNATSTRVSSRAFKPTHKMQGYLTAGKYGSYRKKGQKPVADSSNAGK